MNLELRIANYISRYAPSEKKLREYISKKSHTFPISDFLRENDYTEELMIDMWIRTYLATGVGLRDIANKLIKKGFPKAKIEYSLTKHDTDIRDWGRYESMITTKIDTLIRKGKSLQSIQIILIGKYPYFRDEIREILTQSSDRDNLEKEYEKYAKKYNISHPTDRQKLILALQRKGYHYSDIKDILSKS